MEYSIVFKATFCKYGGSFVKIIGNFVRSMRIGSDRDDLAAKFTITADDGTAWIRLPETIMKTTCIQLDSEIFVNDCAQDLIQNILITFIGIFSVLIRTIADYIVNMPVNIHSGKSVKILKNRFKIFTVTRGFLTIFKMAVLKG